MKHSAAGELENAVCHRGTTSAPAGLEDSRGTVLRDPVLGDEVIQYGRTPRLLPLASERADLLIKISLGEGLPDLHSFTGQPVEDIAGILLNLRIAGAPAAILVPS
jgi:hypothetical protein